MSTSGPFDGYKGLAGETARNTMIRDLISLTQHIHGLNVRAGWWHDLTTGKRKERNVGEMLMLVVSEVAEAMEGHRKSKRDDHLPDYSNFTVECADAMIRLFDLCGGLAEPLADALVDKLEFNSKRADHKPENRRQVGGKAY